MKLKELITRAKQKNEKAMEELFKKFKPLLKSRAKKYSRYGLEYDDVFQQASLLFILAVYDFEEKRDIPFPGYIKKRLNWGLWVYCRKFLKKQMEISCGLNIKGESD